MAFGQEEKQTGLADCPFCGKILDSPQSAGPPSRGGPYRYMSYESALSLCRSARGTYLELIVSVRIRMKKLGRSHQPFFRICAIDRRAPRDGKVIEELGTYDPRVPETDARAILNTERIDYWLSVGAQPSENVAILIKKYGTNGTHVAAQKTALEKLAQPKTVPDPGAAGQRADAEEGKGRGRAGSNAEETEGKVARHAGGARRRGRARRGVIETDRIDDLFVSRRDAEYAEDYYHH